MHPVHFDPLRTTTTKQYVIIMSAFTVVLSLGGKSFALLVSSQLVFSIHLTVPRFMFAK